jgi:hypothetical protein
MLSTAPTSDGQHVITLFSEQQDTQGDKDGQQQAGHGSSKEKSDTVLVLLAHAARNTKRGTHSLLSFEQAAATPSPSTSPACTTSSTQTVTTHTPVLGGWYAHTDRPPPVEVELRIVGSRHRVCAVKVEQVRAAAQHALLHGAAAAEAKVVQPAAQQRTGLAALHAAVKG